MHSGLHYGSILVRQEYIQSSVPMTTKSSLEGGRYKGTVIVIMAAILGFIIIIALVVLIMKEKACAPVIFGFLPVIAALILGFALNDIVKMYLDGFSGAAKNAVLAMFSVTYFYMMNEVGAFDPIVNLIVSKSHGNITAVFLATTAIAMLTTLDGQSASTIVVTVPVMYPIFKKMKIRPVNLAFLITITAGAFMYVPYTSSMMAVSTALNIPVQDIWQKMLPVFGIAVVGCFIMAVIMAKIEEKRIKAGLNDYLDNLESEEAVEEIREISPWHKKMLPVNWIITVVLMVCLFTNKVNGTFLFVFIFSIAVFLNYPNARNQVGIMRKAAPMAMFVAVVFLLAGGYSKVMAQTNMMDAMVSTLLNLAPQSLTRYLHVILGFLAPMLNFVLGADTFYFGLVPLAGNIAASYGISLVSFCVTLMIGKGMSMLCSPTTPNLYLLTDMCHVSTKEYFKYTFFRLWAFAAVLLIIGFIIGAAVV